MRKETLLREFHHFPKDIALFIADFIIPKRRDFPTLRDYLLECASLNYHPPFEHLKTYEFYDQYFFTGSVAHQCATRLAAVEGVETALWIQKKHPNWRVGKEFAFLESFLSNYCFCHGREKTDQLSLQFNKAGYSNKPFYKMLFEGGLKHCQTNAIFLALENNAQGAERVLWKSVMMDHYDLFLAIREWPIVIEVWQQVFCFAAKNNKVNFTQEMYFFLKGKQLLKNVLPQPWKIATFDTEIIIFVLDQHPDLLGKTLKQMFHYGSAEKTKQVLNHFQSDIDFDKTLNDCLSIDRVCFTEEVGDILEALVARSKKNWKDILCQAQYEENPVLIRCCLKKGAL